MVTTAMPTILEDIIAQKRREVQASMKAQPTALIEHLIADATASSRGFYGAMMRAVEGGRDAVIAEIKKASPSKGVIRKNFNPTAIAKEYERSGAACLSVLTDKAFFQGDELYLEQAKEATRLPVLRKDFIISEYQVYESCAMGADCILLIAACLSHASLLQLTRLAYDLGMDVLVEVHSLAELDKVAGLPVRMVGINNRDLHTFKVDLSITQELVPQIPSEILTITESGILTRDDVVLMNTVGVKAFLVGETFMREENPGDKYFELFG